jgi:hypothetical protein
MVYIIKMMLKVVKVLDIQFWPLYVYRGKQKGSANDPIVINQIYQTNKSDDKESGMSESDASSEKNLMKYINQILTQNMKKLHQIF